MKKLLAATLIVSAMSLSYVLGRLHKDVQSSDSHARVLYYIDPMHPAYKSDKPGIAPDCGMQLVPVYADGAAEAASGGAAPSPGAVRIDAKTQQLFGIRVAPVEKAAGARSMRLLGRVAADDTRVYRVTSGAEGWVRQTYNDS